MHGGCFVWTPTAPLSGRRAPRPGPARVCVCVPCLAGSGGPASRARSGAPHLSFGCSWFALCLFDPSGLGLPCLWLLFFFFSFSPSPPSLRPRCVLLCVFSGAWWLGPWRLVPPPFFFPFFCPPPCCLWRFLLSCCLGPLRAPPLFFSFVACVSFFRFFFLFFCAGCALRGGFVCLGPSGVPECASVVPSLSLLCVRWLVLRGVRCWAWLSSAVSW